jgi:peptidoglycan/LPS O-acetylase OafA/YrhL
MFPTVLSDEFAPRLLGNGIGISVSLALLVPVEFLFASQQLWLPYNYMADALISFHLIAFLILRQDCKEALLLDRQLLIWVGDVSYSFYCCAMSVLIMFGSLALTVVPTSWLASNLVVTVTILVVSTSCVLISLILAHFSFEHVEKPGMRIGALWSKRIEAGTFAAGKSAERETILA